MLILAPNFVNKQVQNFFNIKFVQKIMFVSGFIFISTIIISNIRTSNDDFCINCNNCHAETFFALNADGTLFFNVTNPLLSIQPRKTI